MSYGFAGWTGSGTGSYSGMNSPASITMNGPVTETAAFTQNVVQVTVQTSPSGPTFTVDGAPYTSAQSFSWQPGSSHTIATTSAQSGGTGVQYVWKNWSDNGSISHAVSENRQASDNRSRQSVKSFMRSTFCDVREQSSKHRRPGSRPTRLPSFGERLGPCKSGHA